MSRTVQAVDLTDYECETIRAALSVMLRNVENELELATLMWDKPKMTEIQVIVDRISKALDRIPT